MIDYQKLKTNLKNEQIVTRFIQIKPKPSKIFEFIKSDFIKPGKFVVLNNSNNDNSNIKYFF